MQIKAKATGYRSETATNIVLADSFFSVLIMLGWVLYGDIWADVEFSSLWGLKFKMAPMKVYFEQRTEGVIVQIH